MSGYTSGHNIFRVLQLQFGARYSRTSTWYEVVTGTRITLTTIELRDVITAQTVSTYFACANTVAMIHITLRLET